MVTLNTHTANHREKKNNKIKTQPFDMSDAAL